MVLGMARLSQRWNWHGALAPPIHRSLRCTRPSPRNPSSFRRHRTEVLLSTSSACRKRTFHFEISFLSNLSKDNAPPRFVLGEVFVGTLSSLLWGLPLVETKYFKGKLHGCFLDIEGKGKARGLQHSLFGGLRRSRGEFQHFF